MTTHAITPDIPPASISEAQVGKQFAALLDSGCPLRPQGSAKTDPKRMLQRQKPRNLVTLDGHRYFLTNVRRDLQFRFFVGYVQLGNPRVAEHRRALFPRIFYKDSSLVWRVATHYINSENEHWIGKGDIKPVIEGGQTNWYSAEETTNLPFEIQTALDQVSRRVKAPVPDRRALSLILKNAPDDRVEPYADFSKPRLDAMNDAKKRIYNNKPVAWFSDDNDPNSLQFAKGFAPDFENGLIASSSSRSKLYGGAIMRFRISSQNRRIQYLFMRAPTQSWIIPPQPVVLDLMSFGVHSVEAHVDEKLCIPGYEFHFADDEEDDGVFSQIPKGYAGESSTIDPQRADASPWTHNMPIIKNFHAALPGLVKHAGF